MVATQGDVFWANLPDPVGSEAGYRRPVIVVQSDPITRSAIRTVLCVPVTSQLRYAAAPGNVVLGASTTGLPSDSVAVTAQTLAVDKSLLVEKAGKLEERELQLVLAGIDVVLGR